MEYLCRPGVVRLNVCGQYILAPTRSVSESVKEVTRLTLFSASIWGEIERGNDLSNLRLAFEKLTGKPGEEIQKKIDQVIQILYEKGYLIKKQEA